METVEEAVKRGVKIEVLPPGPSPSTKSESYARQTYEIIKRIIKK